MNKFRQLKRWFKSKFNHQTFFYKLVDVVYHNLTKVKYHLTIGRRQKRYYLRKAQNAVSIINKKYMNENYIVFYNPLWLGVANSTKGLFKNIVPLEQVVGHCASRTVSRVILKSNVKIVIFSQIVEGWEDIIKYIKKRRKNLIIKVIWHANNFEVMTDYTWKLNKKVLKLYNDGYIDEFGFVKKSMVDFYNKMGYKAKYLTNNIHIENNESKTKKTVNFKKIKVGLYNANSRELKNAYNQLSAIRLIDGAIVDIVPTNEAINKYASLIKIKYKGLATYINTNELLERYRENDINTYITFTECSPMVPLESFEVGVPCLVGNNNDYFQNSKLKDYVVVDREDDPIYIKNKIIQCLEHRDEIMNLYKEWKKSYDEDCQKYVQDFLEK